MPCLPASGRDPRPAKTSGYRTKQAQRQRSHGPTGNLWGSETPTSGPPALTQSV